MTGHGYRGRENASILVLLFDKGEGVRRRRKEGKITKKGKQVGRSKVEKEIDKAESQSDAATPAKIEDIHASVREHSPPSPLHFHLSQHIQRKKK